MRCGILPASGPLITVGRKGRTRSALIARRNVTRTRRRSSSSRRSSQHTVPARRPDLPDIAPIAESVFNEFQRARARVFIAYTRFITVTQQPRVLPLCRCGRLKAPEADFDLQPDAVTRRSGDYIFRASAAAILEEVIPRLTQLQICRRSAKPPASTARMVDAQRLGERRGPGGRASA